MTNPNQEHVPNVYREAFEADDNLAALHDQRMREAWASGRQAGLRMVELVKAEVARQLREQGADR